MAAQPPKKLSLDDVAKDLSKPPKKLSLEEVDTSFSEPPIERIKNTALESAAKGALQSASFGFADEAEGALLGLRDKIKDFDLDIADAYRRNRDERRLANEYAREDNPGSYLAGEVGGGIASALIPGFGLAKAAKPVSAASSLWAKFAGSPLAHAAKAGALIGVGTSDADATRGDVGNLVEDAATGALVGGVTQGALSGLGALAKGLAPNALAKKAANVVLDTPEEITELYMKNPQAVRGAKPRFEIARDFEEQGIDRLKKEVTEGSAESRAILAKEGMEVHSSQLADVYDAQAQKIIDRSEGVLNDPEMQASVNWLKQNADDLRKADKMLSANRVKDELQGIDRATEFDVGAGRFGRIGDNTKKAVRSDIDAILKVSPAYSSQMEQVAKDARLLAEVTDLSKSQKGLTNLFRKLETDDYGAGQLPRQTLEQLDTRLGTDFLEQAKYSNAKEAFDKSVTRGSMNVNKFSNWLKDVPVLKYMAPLIGASVDKYGREMTIQAVDAAASLNRALAKEGPQEVLNMVRPVWEAAQKGNPAAMITFQVFSESNPAMVKKLENQGAERKLSQEAAQAPGIDLQRVANTPFIKPLMAAAEKGPKDLAITHYMLSQTNPQYQQAMNQKGN